MAKWLKASKIPIEKITESVTRCWTHILSTNSEHRKLVDNIRGRSLADPWVIAHAIDRSAIVVTKEHKETSLNSKRIRIPNVCDNMGVKWIDDFQFISELNIKFSCELV
jgi:hypothetical protein